MMDTKNDSKKLNKFDYPSSESQIFTLENDRLNYVLSVIKANIQHLSNHMPYAGVGMYDTCWDAEDRESLIYQKQENSDNYAKIELMSDYTDSPYFARMDFVVENDNSIEKMYIGKKGIYNDGEFLVYDWRSPVGQRYYIKNQTYFAYDNYQYKLFLRRSLDISNGMLKNVFEEYFDPTVFSPKICDEKVIQQNTNSLQDSQSEIKKAQMLQSSFEDVDALAKTITDPFLLKILKEKRTENKLTDIIRTIQGNQNEIIRLPLSQNLIVQGCAGSGKTMILLHRLSYIKFNNKDLDISRVKIITPNDLFDMHINDLSKSLELDKIERLTVERYYCQIIKSYDKTWDLSKSVLLPEREMDQNYLNYVYSLDFAKNIYQQYNEWKCALESSAETLLMDMANKYEIPIVFKRENGKEVIESITYCIRQIKYFSDLAAKEYTDAYRKTGFASEKLEKSKSKLDKITSQINNQLSEIADKINSELNERIDFLREIRNERRAELSARLQQLAEAEQEKPSSLLNRILNRNRVARILKKEVAVLKNEIIEAQDLIDRYQTEIIVDNNYYDSAIIGTKLAEYFPDRIELNNKLLKVLELEDIQIAGKIQVDKDSLELMELNTIVENAFIKKLSKNEEELLSKAQNELNKLEIKTVCSNIIDASFSDTIDINTIKNRDRLTRASLYSTVMFCLLHFGKSLKPDRIICIDEGQDLSLYEYEIIRKVNAGVVFNIFGDTNQLIKEGRGIQDWNRLKTFTEASLFNLDQNYRNSVEINEYCNKTFGFKSLSIGISCGDVKVMSIHKLQPELTTLLARERVAIIVKNSRILENGVLSNIFSLSNVVNGVIESDKVSILSVEQAKGLEFDRVYVVAKDMSANEKYISFTRALNELIVVI